MNWKVEFAPIVFKQDLPSLPKSIVEDVLRTIRNRLTTDPERYGRPLKGKLFGFWKLRVGDYRVVYQIVKHELIVLVIGIGQRKDDWIYEEMTKRAKWFL